MSKRLKTVSLKRCIIKQGLKFIDENRAVDPTNACLNLDTSTCYFVLASPQQHGNSIVEHVGQGCVCLHIHSPVFVITKIYNETIDSSGNLCSCNVIKIYGCDFVFIET